MPVPQRAPSIPYRCRHHVALWEEVASQAVGELAGIELVVLLLGCSNRAQHQWMCHLDLGGMRHQVIVDPAAEDRRLHRHGPRLGQSLHPRIQLASGRPDLAFLLYPATHVLHAVADRLLVNVQSDIVHSRHRGASVVVLGISVTDESTLCNTTCSSMTNIQTTRPSRAASARANVRLMWPP